MGVPHQLVMLSGLAASSEVLSHPGLTSPFGRELPTLLAALMLPMPTTDHSIMMEASLSTTVRCLKNATLTILVPSKIRVVTGPLLFHQVNTMDRKVLKLSPGIPNAGTTSVVMPLSPSMMFRTGAQSTTWHEKANHLI